MAIAFDASSNGGNNAGSTTASWSHTVSGAEYTIDSYSESNQNTTESLNSGAFPQRSSRGSVFTVSIATMLSRVKFYLSKSGSPTGNAVARIYTMGSGTYGSSGTPSNGASALASSGNFDVSTLTGSLVLTSFNFTNTNNIVLSPGRYCVVLEYTGGDISNRIFMGVNVDSAPHPSGRNECQSSDQSTWSSNTVTVPCFYVYGSNNILWVGSTLDTSQTVTSVTFNSLALAQLDTTGSGARNTYLHYRMNVPIGTYTITVTRSSGAGTLDTTAASYTGAGWAEGSSLSTTTTSSPTINITTITDNAWLIAMTGVTQSAGSLSAGANNHAVIGGSIDGQNFGLWDSNATQGTAGVKSMAWTGSNITLGTWVLASFRPIESMIFSDTQSEVETLGFASALTLSTDTVTSSDSVSATVDRWGAESKSSSSWTAETKTI